MSTTPACCICLATDSKLTDISLNGLDTVLYNFSGIEISADSAFHHVCPFCSALLVKSAAFRDKCLKIQEVTAFLLGSFGKLAKEDILTIQLTNNLISPYQVTTNNTTIDITHSDVKHETPDSDEDLTDYPFEVDFSIENDFSEYDDKTTLKDIKEIKNEPVDDKQEKVAKVVKKKGRRSKKINDDGDKKDEENVVDDAVDSLEVKEVLLTKAQQLQELEKRKDSLNYTHSVYRCELCYKGFIAEDTYRKHAVKHDPCSGEHSCDVCQVRFPDSRSLRAHQAATHERLYVCQRCGHHSKSRFKAKQHTMWHEGFTYNCDLCNASFSKATTYLSHVRKRHARLECALCRERFPTRAGLMMHHARAHSKRAPSYTCDNCQTTFKTDAALARHRASGTEDNPCDTSLSVCVECGEGFANESLLGEHASAGECTLSHSCGLCEHTFSSAALLRRHVTSSHRARPPPTGNMCELCGGIFNSKASMKAHQRSHTGEKPFKCGECEKCFGTSQRLHIHARIHSGERPFKCGVCPKAFRHKAALNRHVRVHTGAKPYACASCDKRFSQSNSAKLHVALVHMKLKPRARGTTAVPPRDGN